MSKVVAVVEIFWWLLIPLLPRHQLLLLLLFWNKLVIELSQQFIFPYSYLSILISTIAYFLPWLFNLFFFSLSFNFIYLPLFCYISPSFLLSPFLFISSLSFSLFLTFYLSTIFFPLWCSLFLAFLTSLFFSFHAL